MVPERFRLFYLLGFDKGGDYLIPHESIKETLEASFLYAVRVTGAETLVKPYLPSEPPTLILAVGKAALPMLSAAREAFPRAPWRATPPLNQESGIAPKEPPGSMRNDDYHSANAGGREGLLPATHPLPSAKSMLAGKNALALVGALGIEDRLLVLISGGGSALWAVPAGINLEEKRFVVEALLRSGADITEMNTVRKHLSRIKGGRLAAHTRARVYSLIVSDVPGDDPAIIASGPTAPDPTTYRQALSILQKYAITHANTRRHLLKGIGGLVSETPKPSETIWDRVENRVIGSNYLLLRAARDYWTTRGARAVILSSDLQGEARDLAYKHAEIIHILRAGPGSGARSALRTALASLDSEEALEPAVLEELFLAHEKRQGPLVLISGGETTVTVKGRGRGGRNQEFALWLLHYLGADGIWALSAGSDGVDGNSRAAGAFLSPDSYQRASQAGLDAAAFLSDNDSNGFFKRMKDELVTGYTQNNLNDFRAIVIELPPT